MEVFRAHGSREYREIEALDPGRHRAGMGGSPADGGILDLNEGLGTRAPGSPKAGEEQPS
ncbi:hypothetical protein Hesp01_37400 [Herbidospora sp. NBRC 101105]|nr:hypothetical protein Hesp01_37400 [Herbidospora sp. NBRC 101105]